MINQKINLSERPYSKITNISKPHNYQIAAYYFTETYWQFTDWSVVFTIGS